MPIRFVTLLSLLSLIFFSSAAPPAASAEDDFIAVAVKVVRQFHTESRIRLRKLEPSAAVDSFRTKSLKSHELTAKDIKSLRWIEKPGPRRFNLIYNRVNAYTDAEIRSVRSLASEVSTQESLEVERTAKSLLTLKKAKLEKLVELLPLETFKRAEPQPVPIVDRAPFETKPTKGDGIWYR